MPAPILPDGHAPAEPPRAGAAGPRPDSAGAQSLAGGRELASTLPEWDLLPPSNVISFRRGPR